MSNAPPLAHYEAERDRLLTELEALSQEDRVSQEDTRRLQAALVCAETALALKRAYLHRARSAAQRASLTTPSISK